MTKINVNKKIQLVLHLSGNSNKEIKEQLTMAKEQISNNLGGWCTIEVCDNNMEQDTLNVSYIIPMSGLNNDNI